MSGLVEEFVNPFDGEDRRSRPTWQDRHAVTDAARVSGLQCLPREVGQHAPRRLSPQRRRLFHRLKHVIVEIQGRPHAWIITHHASDVNAGC